jgi:hypothetical protein
MFFCLLFILNPCREISYTNKGTKFPPACFTWIILYGRLFWNCLLLFISTNRKEWGQVNWEASLNGANDTLFIVIHSIKSWVFLTPGLVLCFIVCVFVYLWMLTTFIVLPGNAEKAAHTHTHTHTHTHHTSYSLYVFRTIFRLRKFSSSSSVPFNNTLTVREQQYFVNSSSVSYSQSDVTNTAQETIS